MIVHCPTNTLPIHRAYSLHFLRIFFETAAEETSKPPTLLRKDCLPSVVPPRLSSLCIYFTACSSCRFLCSSAAVFVVEIFPKRWKLLTRPLEGFHDLRVEVWRRGVLKLPTDVPLWLFGFPFFEFVLGKLYAEFVQDLISEYGHPKLSHETLKRRCIRQVVEKEFWSHY